MDLRNDIIFILLLGILINHPLSSDALGQLLNKGETEIVKKALGDTVIMTCSFKVDAINDMGFFYAHGQVAYTLFVSEYPEEARKLPAPSQNVPGISFTGSEEMVDNSLIFNLTATITSLMREHQGEFKCSGGGEKIYNVQVVGKPYAINLTAESENLELSMLPAFDTEEFPGSSAVWKAEVNIDIDMPTVIKAVVSSNPEANSQWEVVSVDKQVMGTLLSLNKEELNKTARYKFTASNDYGSSSVILIIETQYKPRPPRVIGSDLYPELGKIAQARCQFDAKPAVSVFYIKEDPADNSWKRINDTSNELKITSFDLDRHIGVYKCIGENKYGNSSGTIRVHAKPRDVALTVGNAYGSSLDLRFKSFSALPVMFNLTINSNGTEGAELRTWTIDNRVPQVVPNIELVYIAYQLEPETDYSLHLVAWNRHGSTESETVHTRTASINFTRPPTTTTEAVTRSITSTPSVTKNKVKDDNSSSMCTLSSLLVMVISLSVLRLY